METILLKTCSKCGEYKELAHYHKYPKGIYEQHRKEGKSTKGIMKAVDKLTLDGEMIKRYHSISAASRDNNNLHIGTIQSVCTGKTKTCGGFKWRYSLEPNNNKH